MEQENKKNVKLVRLAILIPVYNDYDGLCKSIESIEAPDLMTIEIVIVDDGSQDKIEPSTLNSIHKVTVINLTVNQGIVGALNQGLKYIYDQDFDFIARLDSGDINVNDRLRKQIKCFKELPELILVGSNARFVDTCGNDLFDQKVPSEDSHIRKKMHYNNCFCHPATMFKANNKYMQLYYDPSYLYAEDYKFFFELSKFGKIKNINEILVITEANPAGISRTKRRLQLKLRLKFQLEVFNPKLVHSYMGIAQTCLLLALPEKSAEFIKVLFKKLGK